MFRSICFQQTAILIGTIFSILNTSVSALASSEIIGKTRPVYILHVRLGNAELAQNIDSELKRSFESSTGATVEFIRPDLNAADNPFLVTGKNFLTSKDGQIPLIPASRLSWFENLIAQNKMPDIFIINGHHVPGLGFHSDTTYEAPEKNADGESLQLYTKSLFMPSIHKSIETYPILKKFFSRTKLVFVGGCWGLSNFEQKSNGISGDYLNPEKLAQIYLTNKSAVIGSSGNRHSLEGQRWELATIYGGDFTRSAANESCSDSSKLICDKYHADRVMPDSMLFDGSHRFNQPHWYKKSFPNALGVFGFFSPSPRTPGSIWQSTFNQSRERMKINNVLLPLFDEATSIQAKKTIIQSLRISWTRATYLINRNRPSGSITPAFPDLDKNGLFAYDEGAPEYPLAPKYAPYY